MKYTYLLFFVMINFFSYSQEKRESVISSEKYIKTGWYFSPATDISIIDQNYEVILSLDGGVNLNKNFCVGLFYSTVITSIDIQGYSADDGYKNYLDMAGLNMSYIFIPDKIIHPRINLKSGAANLAVENTDTGIFTNFTQFLLIPGISFDMNISSNISIGIQSSFRLIAPADLYIYKEAGLSGSQIGLSLMIGNF